MITKHMSAILFAIPILLSTQTVHGAGGDDNYSSSAQKPDGYNEAVSLIAAEKYQDAIAPLQSAEKLAKNDADVQNLLGFVYRKTGKLDVAGVHYKRALEIDPKHKGALEYQGELFLMHGNIEAAQANLAKLDKICWLGCDEYDDLKKAIAESQ